MNTLASASSVGIGLDIPTMESERKNVIRGSILLPVDGLPEALAAAEHLARDIGGESGVHVHVLHVTPFIHRHIGRYLSAEAKRSFIAERAAIAVDPVRNVLERAGLKITVHVSTNLDIAAEVLAVAEREQCARIVMGATRKSTLVGTVTNSVTARVLADATVPVEVILGRDASRWQRIGLPACLGLALVALTALLIMWD